MVAMPASQWTLMLSRLRLMAAVAAGDRQIRMQTKELEASQETPDANILASNL